MLTTIDRSAETATTIRIPVTITLGEPGTFSHDVAHVTAAGPHGSEWIVIWTLEHSENLSAHFADIPIVFTSLPDGVDHSDPVLNSAATECQLTFTNNVSDVNVIRYKLALEVHDVETRVRLRFTPLIIDPTISVVKDPIDG